jgi:hypothetical protein
MLVESCRKELCRPPNPKAQHLRCYAHLDGDITEVLPYLNTVLADAWYTPNRPLNSTVQCSRSAVSLSRCRGRDAGRPAPPAQIRT